MATHAASYAEKCKFEHNKENSKKSVGENLAAGTKFSNESIDETFAVKKIVNSLQSWADEAEHYTYGQPNFKMTDPKIQISHYTAVRKKFLS